MELRILFTWWIIFYIRYSRLFWIYPKIHGEKTDNSSIRIYVNKIENRITFKINKGYYFELLTPKAMQLLASNKKGNWKWKRWKCASLINYWSNISPS